MTLNGAKEPSERLVGVTLGSILCFWTRVLPREDRGSVETSEEALDQEHGASGSPGTGTE